MSLLKKRKGTERDAIQGLRRKTEDRKDYYKTAELEHINGDRQAHNNGGRRLMSRTLNSPGLWERAVIKNMAEKSNGAGFFASGGARKGGVKRSPKSDAGKCTNRVRGTFFTEPRDQLAGPREAPRKNAQNKPNQLFRERDPTLARRRTGLKKSKSKSTPQSSRR